MKCQTLFDSWTSTQKQNVLTKLNVLKVACCAKINIKFKLNLSSLFAISSDLVAPA